MQELQVELKSAKERWGREVELSKAEKGAPNYPFPVCCTRYTPRPESAAAWDCEELPLRLVVDNADLSTAPVQVEVPDIFPGDMSAQIEQRLEAQWKKFLGRKSKGSCWKIETMLEWVEGHFAELLRIIPEYVEMYEGCDDMGASMRRYTLVGPAPNEEEEVGDGVDDDGIDDEENQARMEEYLERERLRIEEAVEEKYKLSEERRKCAEAGIFESGEKVKQMSKKELAETHKSRKERSGHRWRKEASKSHKPVLDEDQKKKREQLQKKKKVVS